MVAEDGFGAHLPLTALPEERKSETDFSFNQEQNEFSDGSSMDIFRDFKRLVSGDPD